MAYGELSIILSCGLPPTTAIPPAYELKSEILLYKHPKPLQYFVGPHIEIARLDFLIQTRKTVN